MSSAYRRLVHLYPKRFRDEYGDDLVALFEQQRRDEPAARVWWRAVRDLGVTIPTQHLEARMQRPAQHTVTRIAVGGALVSALATAVLGTMMAPLLLLLSVLCGFIARESWRAERDADEARMALVRSWWKLIAGGIALVAGLIAVTVAWPPSMDLSGDIAWMLSFATVMVAVAMVGAGVMLGVGQLVSRLLANRRTTGR